MSWPSFLTETGWSWPGALAGAAVGLGLALVVVGVPMARRPGLIERLEPYLRDTPRPSGLLSRSDAPSVAGMVAPGGTKVGHRHLHCSLCATSWRYVRTRCVHCGSTDKISFRQFAGTSYV